MCNRICFKCQAGKDKNCWDYYRGPIRFEGSAQFKTIERRHRLRCIARNTVVDPIRFEGTAQFKTIERSH